MDEQFIQYLTKAAKNIGPDAREAFLCHVEDEYCNGNIKQSIFYQMLSLYQTSQEYFYKAIGAEPKRTNVESLMAAMNDQEKSEFKDNCLMQYVSKSLKTMTKFKEREIPEETVIKPEGNFLKGITDPLEGIHKLETICKKMPKEWSILQLCKGPRTETTFSIYPNIHESDAAIYLTIIKHALSDKYPTPICLRFSGNKQKDLFRDFGNIVNSFKQCIKVDRKDWDTQEARKFYWNSLSKLDTFIAKACEDLKTFFFPWRFLFSGIVSRPSEASNDFNERCNIIERFSNVHQLDYQSKILLSLAALNIGELSSLEIVGICTILLQNEEQRELAIDMLNEMQQQSLDDLSKKEPHYPCILVIDERLDHFFWEELNVYQEFTRFNSLQCLWRLYEYYKKDIVNGYLQVNITNGGCILNPDQNLNQMEERMRSFVKYWMPHWKLLVGQRPTTEELSNNFYKRNCYVYAGHGSGLQYITGRNIAKLQMQCVVFLFGCDSSRLHSNGLYSELWGPHLYYHAAMCPALVGTLMPCLDSFMDKVATEILSRWIAPKSPNVIPWTEVDQHAWIKGGNIKRKLSKDDGVTITSLVAAASCTTTTSMANYHSGSLCGILARIRQRITEPKLYNTVPYVCRGLPVWNCHVQSPPS
ncbi:extra spindle pole bodies like 1, separase [Haematobia irritans]|uniref:extra spindle pole bodies like 1, separase n=1 Tax=Haematobia irritans TaxID=7368 RepID=UPI003F504BB4